MKRLVSVVVGLVRTLDGETEVVGLLGGELGELDVELGQVGSGNLLVEGLGEHVDTEGVGLVVGPKGDLGHDLVGERAGHDEGGVTGTASEVDQSTLGEEDDVSAGRHGESVDLGLDVDGLGGSLLEPGNVNLDVKVTDAGRVSQGNNDTKSGDATTHLQTMASSCMTSKCLPTMMSRLPVVVTKTLARGAASSMVVTS